MNLLASLAKSLKGHQCEMMIKRTGNEIILTDIGTEMGSMHLNIANFSNKVIEFVKATEVAMALDDSQYLLCITSCQLDKDDQLRKDCQRIRLMLIMAFNQLRAILESIKETNTSTITENTKSVIKDENNKNYDELRQQLIKWIEYMSELHKQSISLLEPGPKLLSKGPKMSQIMKYQGINEDQIEEALKIMYRNTLPL